MAVIVCWNSLHCIPCAVFVCVSVIPQSNCYRDWTHGGFFAFLCYSVSNLFQYSAPLVRPSRDLETSLPIHLLRSIHLNSCPGWGLGGGSGVKYPHKAAEYLHRGHMMTCMSFGPYSEGNWKGVYDADRAHFLPMKEIDSLLRKAMSQVRL